jgi:hypothetical protein
VAARRVGWASLSLKFARRNKVGVALAAVLALALAGGTAGIAWQGRVAAREAARAEQEAARAGREAARANAVKNYLIGLFEQGDPRGGGKPSETITVRELLDHGTDQIDTALAGQPETAMELLDALGHIYDALEDPSRATQVESRRLQLARSLYGDDDPRVVNGTIDLAESRSEFLDRSGAQALLQSIRQSVFTHYGADSLERARWLTGWADSLRTTDGGGKEALADARQAVAIFQAHFPTNDDYMSALFELADFQADADQYEASLATLRQRQKMLAAQGSNDAIHKLEYMTAAGNTLRHLGRYDEAKKLLAENQVLAEQVVGRQGSYYLSGLRTTALIANDLGKRAEAMALFSQGMAIATGRGATTGGVNSLRRAYGRVLVADDDTVAAIPLLEETLRQTQLHPRDESDLPLNQGYLGDAYDQAGRAAEARPLLQAARDYWVRYGVPTGTFTLGGRERWARFLLDHGDPEAARAECNEILRVAAGAALAQAALAQADLARLALVRGNNAGAEQFSAQAMQTIDAVTLGYDVRARTDVWLTRAESLLANGKKPEAAELGARALAAAQESDAPGSARLARAMEIVRKSR